ncbi:MAG: ABC transporter permease [Phycisphaerae bacterium]|nr:ABC transporter permease [Gemmatimonadaceae bacterium]
MRVAHRGRELAALLTAMESVQLAVALLGERVAMRRARRTMGIGRSVAARGRAGPVISRLDFKLGLRMVVRYPSLTVVAVLAMAFGIATGAAAFEYMKGQLFPPLPYRDAARIVAIQNINIETTQLNTHVLDDFEHWRDELQTIRNVSALYLRKRNLIHDSGPSFAVSETQTSASAFGLLRHAPLLGRGILPADEVANASPVVVVSYELWRNSFGGAQDIIGRIVRLSDVQRTIIGVMPEGFTFFIPREGVTIPAAQDVWTPMQLHEVNYAVGEGPDISVIGEMVVGATPEMVGAELATMSARRAAASPRTHQYQRTQLLQFALPFNTDGAAFPTIALSLGTVFIAALMIVMCGNVALLLFARAATREREIAIRSALGASRGSIVMQLFAESLVLATMAITVGLVIAAVALKWAVRVSASMMRAEGLVWPAWVGDTLSPSTIGFAAALALLGAVVVGVLPGLKVTSNRGSNGPQRLIGNGGSGVKLGGIWTTIIIAQVSLTAMLVPIAVAYGVQTRAVKMADRKMPSGHYLAARIRMNGETQRAGSRDSATAASPALLVRRFQTDFHALAVRLASEPGVSGVTVAQQLPGSVHETRRFQTDVLGDGTGWERRAQIAMVAANFFEVFHTRIVAGRDFATADSNSANGVVIVNESFVREYLGGGNAVGHRVRYRDNADRNQAGAWHTIVGVVDDIALGLEPTAGSSAGIYHVLHSGAQNVEMAVHINGSFAQLTARVHELAAEVGPSLNIQRVMPLQDAGLGTFIAYDAWFRIIVLCGVMAILLTNAGIYAVISFTVARRTREIGVRVALGAEPKEVISVVLGRAARHVAIGVAIGAAVGMILVSGLLEGGTKPTLTQSAGILVVYMSTMTTVCLLACVVPVRRALGIQPMVALGAEG